MAAISLEARINSAWIIVATLLEARRDAGTGLTRRSGRTWIIVVARGLVRRVGANPVCTRIIGARITVIAGCI